MHLPGDEAGLRRYRAVLAAVAGGELTVEVLAARAGCTPDQVLRAVLAHDREGRLLLEECDGELLVRAAD